MELPSNALPPPKSGSYSELSFRRLLRNCDEIIAGDSKEQNDLSDRKSSSALREYVTSLERQLADLESRVSKRVQPEVLEQYTQHVNRVKETLPPENKSLEGPSDQISQPDEVSTQNPQIQSESLPGAETPLTGSNPSMPHIAMFSPQPSNLTRQAPPAATQPNLDGLRRRTGPAQDAPLSQAMQKKLQMHDNLQEDVSDDMLGLSSQMLANAQAMQGAVQAREQLLAQTELAQDASAINADYAVKTSKNIKKRGAVGLCVRLGILLAVGLTIPLMYIFIRSTYFLGYKAK